jgi:carboxymethylenebutenolidase
VPGRPRTRLPRPGAWWGSRSRVVITPSPVGKIPQVTTGIQELMRLNERVRDGFRRDVLAGDVDAALAAVAPAVSVLHVPVMTGAHDQDTLHRHLTEDVVGHLPADLTHTRTSRTVDRFRVVDEERVAFTHGCELPWLLPGIAPTHRHVEVLAITVVTVQQARITSLRTLWDHAGLLAQLGLSPVVGGAESVPLHGSATLDR